MDSLQAVETYKMPFYQTHLPESLTTENDSQEFPELLEFRKLKNRYHERPILIEITPEERVKAFLPEKPLIGDIELVYYLETNNRKLINAGISVRQCYCCKPEENIHLVSYKEDASGSKRQTRFLAKIGGRNGNSDKRPGFLFVTKDYESFGDYVCPYDFAAIRRNRYNITTA